MKASLPVEVSGLAAQHIRELELWWRRNRMAAPNAVRKELQRTLRLITATPYIGSRASDIDLADVRRIHIPRIWYFLYCRVLHEPRRIELLALSSDRREDGPPI